jgi:predicted nucleotidyltransferase
MRSDRICYKSDPFLSGVAALYKIPEQLYMHKLEEKITAYFKNKKEVIAVYLFGSYAEGKDGDLSDIDIGILLDRNYRDFFNERRNDYMVELGRLMRKDIDPVILNSASQELLRQIFSKGKCILVNDSKELARYKMVMFARIAEFAYYRNQMQLGLIRKIMEG